MKNPKFDVLWFVVPAVAAVLFLAMYQRQNSQEEANAPGQQVQVAEPGIAEPGLAEPGVEADNIAPQPAPAGAGVADAGVATIDPAVAVSNPANLPTDTLEQDREFIGRAFPLLSTWNLPEVKPLLSPDTVAASSDAELAAVMTTLKDRLGSLQSFEPPQPVPMAVDTATSTDDHTLQQYQFLARYEAGEAEVNLILQKQAQSSSLYSFDINVPN